MFIIVSIFPLLAVSGRTFRAPPNQEEGVYVYNSPPFKALPNQDSGDNAPPLAKGDPPYGRDYPRFVKYYGDFSKQLVAAHEDDQGYRSLPINQEECFHEIKVNETDAFVAQRALASWCEKYYDRGLKNGDIVYAKYGSAIWWVCDYRFMLKPYEGSAVRQICTRNEIQGVVEHFMLNYDVGMAFETDMNKWYKGYGLAEADGEMCRRMHVH